MSSTLLNAAAAAAPSLGAATVRAALESTTQASILLQLYTQTVAATPNLTLPARVDEITGSTVSKDLPAHQQTARTNATYFLNELNPLLASTSASVIGFGNSWDSEFSALMGYVPRISDPAARASFDSGLKVLQDKIAAQQSALGPLLDKLGAFQKLVIIDHDNLSTDSALVTKAFDGIGGEIATLKAKIETENGERGKYIGIIVGGVLGLVGGVIMIIVGAVATIATEGLAVGLVLGGIAIVAGGTGAFITASAELADLDRQIGQDRTALASDQAIFASVEQGAHNAASLVDAVEKGLAALSTLQSSWQQLAADFDQVKQDLDVANPDAGSWLTTILNKANDEWNEALGVAKSLQRFGNLPVENKTYGEAA
ncbi:HBL/NHE enterotoxin family protein [Amaricoccus sp.]|uniref:HBL/NHE enterotoxin family protein n=1 Tax=Amaricoccus sp. TaxID=1872485 RepID=UPI002BF313D7|nr:HBL/NHE enterotoxin family protein [Amaricoccus sp.]HRW15251.1 HBL/NHE enterotoxin family protein [Amaricoccus sp.]